MSLSGFFFFSFFWCSHIGNYPQEELAKYGCRSEKIVNFKKNTHYILVVCWNLLYKYGDFSKKNPFCWIFLSFLYSKCVPIKFPMFTGPESWQLRPSPAVLSMWLQTVKFIGKKAKCAGLAQEIGFPEPNSCSLPRLVKGATQLCTSKKECNKLYMTVAQYFWLVDHNDWSRWFAISSPHVFQLQFYWWGCQNRNS
jgi:hypothetical protein